MGKPVPDGLGAFVRLDYNTNSEHAIVLMAEKWESLYDFIYAPGQFIEMWRNGYDQTPEHKHLKFQSRIWELEGPITFIIEPITIPSASNAVTLASLEPLYHGLQAVAAAWKTTTPEKFLNKVTGIVEAAATSWDPLPPGFVESDLFPPIKRKSFAFAYIAEFAIKTRTVTIKYIPRKDQTLKYTHLPLTTMTVNQVRYTNLYFVHFDLHFLNNQYTRTDLADARAKFAIEFLQDPSFINNVSQVTGIPVQSKKGAAPMLPNMTGKVLQEFNPNPAKRPYIKGEAVSGRYQPRLVIDSVWPDPANPKYGDHLKEIEEHRKHDAHLGSKNLEKFRHQRVGDVGEPPLPAWETEMPQLCVLLQALIESGETHINFEGTYMTMEALIKAYTSPEPMTGP